MLEREGIAIADKHIKIHGAGVKENTFVKKIELNRSRRQNQSRRQTKADDEAKKTLSMALSSKNHLSKLKEGMWMTFTMHGISSH